MKLKAPAAVLATARLPLGIFFAVFLTIIYASSAVAKTGAGALNPVETWVVAQVRIGEIADLSKQFPDKEKDKRRLSAHFLEDLLMGALTGLKPHRHGVRIIGAIIDEPIDLQNAQIRCQVWLDHCQFNKSVTFYGANFAEFVSFENSAFKAEANFESMKVGGTAFFQNAVFDGPVNFVSADIGWLEANGAQFRNKEKLATFGAMKVGGTAFFQNAVFDGPVNFVGANIASDFGAQGAKFQNKEQGANFESMKVRHTAFFQNAVFDGPVNFVGANIASNFQANGVQFQNMEQRANFNSMKVGGAALFNDAVFEGSVDLRNADFAWLDLSSPFWPKDAAQFSMQGMSYKYIRAGPLYDEPESHKALLTLADQSVYTADVYSNLEEFFLRQGYRDDADRAFIAGKRRERKENLHDLGWLGSWLLDWLVGYGRRPFQAGIPCAVLVALGCVLFSPKKMEPQKPEDTPRVYSRFWYSLGLFLPFVDLQADKVWKPKADQTFLRNYMRVHIMLGWILVPLVLAALTGLIK